MATSASSSQADPRGHAGTRGRGAPVVGRAWRRSLRAAVPLAAVALVSACTYVAPQDTNRSMVPGDGMSFDLGPFVAVSSLMIITREEDDPGVLIARVTNSASDPVSVTITGAGLDEELEVPGNQTVAIGGVEPGSERIVVESVPQGPGFNVPMTFSTSEGSSRETVAPVQDGTFDRYAPYVDEIPTT